MAEKYSIKQYNDDRAKAVKAVERADTYMMALTVDGKGCFLMDAKKNEDAKLAWEALLSAISQMPGHLKIQIIFAASDKIVSADANGNPDTIN
ncbi:MAG TPA: hypothetical protein DCX19_04640 [Alphaproteobacteria bacterium]|nr:hypothetical protein [Alphaproteobacteria bacterium]